MNTSTKRGDTVTKPLATTVERFLTAKTAAGKSARTVEFYRSELARIADWLRTHDRTLDDAGPEDIEMYLAAERSRGLTSSSVEAHYRALSAFYRWLHARQRLIGVDARPAFRCFSHQRHVAFPHTVVKVQRLGV